MARQPRSEYAKRYQRLRRRIAAWRKISDAMAALAAPVLVMLIEADDLVVELSAQRRASPDDKDLRRDLLEAIRARQRFLDLIAQAPGSPEAEPDQGRDKLV